jgi:hypothetical protein
MILQHRNKEVEEEDVENEKQLQISKKQGGKTIKKRNSKRGEADKRFKTLL